MATAGRAATTVNEPSREIPVAYQVDVVVVGGSTGAVSAATSAARAGAKVFLAAPHPYLGDDMTATLRLWPEPGATPRSPLARQLFTDPLANMFCADPNRLALDYEASVPSADRHKDTQPPSLLTAGLWGNAADGSVQYNSDVRITADLHSVQAITKVRMICYERLSPGLRRGEAFKTDRIDLSTSDDKRVWQPLAVLRSSDARQRQEDDLGGCIALEATVAAKCRYVSFSVHKAPAAGRMLLGQIEIVGPGRHTAVQSSELRPVRPLHVKQTLDEALIGAGVDFLYGCYATDVLRDASGNPCGIVMANRAGRQAVVAKTIVDATERALVARLAGVEFRPYPAGQHTFHRVVIGGEPRSGPGLDVLKVEPSFRGAPRVLPTEKRRKPRSATGTYPIYDYTLRLSMKDGSFASWADAEQRARQMTYQPEQQFTSDELFEIPPDPMHGRASGSGPWPGADKLPLGAFRPARVGRLYVLGGCADISREQAERLLWPLPLVDLGARIGLAAATEAKTLPIPADPRLPKTAMAGQSRAEVRESLAGIRAVQDWSKIRQEARALPVLGSYDVVVVGGGTGGAPAGIAAARQGAKTLVVEYLHSLGGVGTVGAISSYCAGNRVGFTATVLDDPKCRPWFIEPKIEWWRGKLRAAGADIWCGAIGCGAVVENGRVLGAVVATPQGRGVVLGKVVVDATGNADIASAAGAECIYTGAGEFAMQGTGLPPRQLGASYANTDFTFTDETDLVDVWHVLVFAKHKYPRAFDQGQLIDTRERRCIVGEYTLNILDEITRRTYADTVIQACGGAYDTHGYTVDPYLLVTHPGTAKLVVNIPYRCLVPKGLEGILATGLGISAQRDAIPLIRMQVDIQNGGYAAGVAAAMTAKSGSLLRHIDIHALQEHLVEMGNLTPAVLTDRDSYPVAAEKVAEAVKSLVDDNPPALAVVFAQPHEALPLLRDAYTASTGKNRLTYAVVLAVLGDRGGLSTLLDHVRRTPQWDRGWNYKGMGQFGNAMSPLDTQIVALGRTGDRRAVPVILEKLRLLSAESEFSHHRAVGLALELLGDPAAAAALAGLLAQPGMTGHVQTTIQQAIQQETPGGTSAEQTRRESVRELLLARALYRCGDQQGLGRQILAAYTHDLRGHLARHAQAVPGRED
jgi:flavin-dependent dehydrogenase